MNTSKKYGLIILFSGILLAFIVSLKSDGGMMYGDALGYYTYLPAAIIHKNLDEVDQLADLPNLEKGIARGIKNFKTAYPQNEKGNTIVQYSYGVAAVNSPAFFFIHLLDNIQSKEATGFEKRYQTCMQFINVFYLFLGLFFCFKAMCFYYDPIKAFVASILLLIGTNLFWFGFIQFGMAHIPLFMLISLLLYLSIQQSHKCQNRRLMAMAFVLGLITIIRPTDIIFGLIPLVYIIKECSRNQSYKSRFISNLKVAIPLGIIVFLIPIIPQMLYWKALTGEYVYYSYASHGFNWTNPQILKGLFGAKNGWFVYSPLMLLAIIPFFFKQMQKEIRILFFILLPLYMYIVYSWFNYYYINGFGSRPMIHVYAIMVFGIASLLSLKNRLLRIASLVLIAVAAMVNLNFTLKAKDGRLFSDESTHAFNTATFFKSELDYADLYLLGTRINQESYSDANCDLIKSLSFEGVDSTLLLNDVKEGMQYYSILKEDVFPVGNIAYVITEKDILNYSSICGSTMIRFNEHVYMPYSHQKMVLQVERDGEQVYWECISLNEKVGKRDSRESKIEIRATVIDTWDTVSFYFPISKLKTGDQVKMYLWNPAKRQSDFGGLELSLCK